MKALEREDKLAASRNETGWNCCNCNRRNTWGVFKCGTCNYYIPHNTQRPTIQPNKYVIQRGNASTRYSPSNLAGNCNDENASVTVNPMHDSHILYAGTGSPYGPVVGRDSSLQVRR